MSSIGSSAPTNSDASYQASYNSSATNRSNRGLRQAPPPPLRLKESSFNTNSRSGSNFSVSSTANHPSQSPPTLLYELPPSSASPRRSSHLPTSPPVPPKRSSLLHHPRASPHASQSGTPYSGPTSPPPRPRSSTPVAAKQDLDIFAEQCRSWYYQQDPLAGRAMSQTLASLPPAQRPTYTRLQATIRSAYHADQSRRRMTEFRAHLSATQPGQSLTPAARSDSTGARARKEREEKFGRFVRGQCLSTLPGTHPFFQGLYALMRLQVLPPNLGGAGDRRIWWEVDDAIFIESAGKDFMLEAIDVLKGVLGFEEHPSEQTNNRPLQPEQPHLSVSDYVEPPDSPLSPVTKNMPLHALDGRGRRQSQAGLITPKTMAIMPGNRPRKFSDPFMDSSRSSPASTAVGGQDDSVSGTGASTPFEPSEAPTPDSESIPPHARALLSDPDSPELNVPLRIWTISPSLSNPELQVLLAHFPSFITPKQLPRFTSIKNAPTGAKALEEGDAAERGEVRAGTGRLGISAQARDPGWQGGIWYRMKVWLKNLFS